MKNSPLKLIDLYPYRIDDSKPEFLLLKRAGDKIYSGQWRMVGGKVKEGELRWKAALRELKEETGLEPMQFWSVPTLNHFYDHKRDQIHLIPAFAAEVDSRQKVRLDDEHSDHSWVTAGEIDAYVRWPEQCRIIAMIDQLISTDQILEDWIISTE